MERLDVSSASGNFLGEWGHASSAFVGTLNIPREANTCAQNPKTPIDIALTLTLSHPPNATNMWNNMEAFWKQSASPTERHWVRAVFPINFEGGDLDLYHPCPYLSCICLPFFKVHVYMANVSKCTVHTSIVRDRAMWKILCIHKKLRWIIPPKKYIVLISLGFLYVFGAFNPVGYD